MAEDFVPSPSLDSHVMPMEVQIPLLETSHGRNSSNPSLQKPFVDSTNKTTSPSFHQKISNNYDSPSDKRLVQSVSHEARTPTMFDRIFCVSQLKTLSFYQALISEFIGTMLLLIIGASGGLPFVSGNALQGALTAGFAVATMIVGFGHTSGAHVNPAVTLTFLAAFEIDLLRGLCYIGMQLLGASFGTLLLKFITPIDKQGNLGMTMITEGISLSQACLVEFIITFILCYTVHAICDKHRDDVGGSKALVVGLAVVIGCLFGGPYTGGSMNPARAFGPAWAMGSWENHWVYWFGPMAGSIASAIVYTHVLKHHHPHQTE